jgi:hypothetical protein
VPFRFTGDSQRMYTQYLAADGTPLIASPGGTYDMYPVASLPLPVPPGDGLWEVPASDPGPPSVRPLPPAALTSSPAEDEGN